MQYPVTAIIGAGNMATAVIAGLIESGYPADKIIAANRGQEKLQALSSKFGIGTTQNNRQAVQDAEVVILAVKPAVIKTVCTEIAEDIEQQLILSLAAGKKISTIKKYLDCNGPVIRAMPNTPCLLSKGTTGLFAEPQVSQTNRDFVTSLFSNIGEVVWLDSEIQIDVVTALSGSGPAYYFYLAEAMIKAGVELGLDEAISQKLVNQTALGSAAMLTNQPVTSAKDLRKAVTSPNGTTEAATNLFDKNELMKIIINGVRAGTNRGTEISNESE
ncbi:MAG: pyrroline-5-carboxylate reductase [Gammaproteobacteria bacterium]|nr:MAG: pyrroline-5-carboxylate reductase [Gammaproteobacteria bacterium]